MTNSTLVNQTKINSINIWDVSDVTVVTDVQSLSTGIRLPNSKSRLWSTQLHNYRPNTATRLIAQPQPESDCGHRTQLLSNGLFFRRPFTNAEHCTWCICRCYFCDCKCKQNKITRNVDEISQLPVGGLVARNSRLNFVVIWIRTVQKHRYSLILNLWPCFPV